jgi:hypothetical protein
MSFSFNFLPGRYYVTPPVQAAAFRSRLIFPLKGLDAQTWRRVQKPLMQSIALRNASRRSFSGPGLEINHPVSVFAAGSAKHTAPSTSKSRGSLILMRETTDGRTFAELCNNPLGWHF